MPETAVQFVDIRDQESVELGMPLSRDFFSAYLAAGATIATRFAS